MNIKEKVIDILLTIIDNAEAWDCRWYQKELFKQQTYTIWAAYEMLDLIYESDKDPECIIESFMHKMDKFSTLAKNDKRFSIAADTAKMAIDDIIFVRYIEKTQEG